MLLSLFSEEEEDYFTSAQKKSLVEIFVFIYGYYFVPPIPSYIWGDPLWLFAWKVTLIIDMQGSPLFQHLHQMFINVRIRTMVTHPPRTV